jgi:ankyrin repeat protein
MPMSAAQAQRLVERLDLIGPCHGSVPGDFDRVTTLFAAHPRLPRALNALDPGHMEETPQGAAAHLFCREILLFMLDRGVRVDLFMACALGDLETAERFLRADPSLANARGAHGIHVLNHSGSTAVAGRLLEHGADPNRPVYQPWGWTPLHEAACRGRRGLLETLAAAGGRLDAAPNGLTPLHPAARMGHREVVEWLVERGVDLAITARGAAGPWRGKTALMLAEENGHAEIAAFLRRRGARE